MDSCAVRQQAITWSNVVPVPLLHISKYDIEWKTPMESLYVIYIRERKCIP